MSMTSAVETLTAGQRVGRLVVREIVTDDDGGEGLIYVDCLLCGRTRIAMLDRTLYWRRDCGCAWRRRGVGADALIGGYRVRWGSNIGKTAQRGVMAVDRRYFMDVFRSGDPSMREHPAYLVDYGDGKADLFDFFFEAVEALASHPPRLAA